MRSSFLKYTFLALYLPFLAFGWWFDAVMAKSLLLLPECFNNQAFAFDVLCFSFSLMAVLALLTGLLWTRTDFSKGMKRFLFAAAATTFVLYILFLCTELILPVYLNSSP